MRNATGMEKQTIMYGNGEEGSMKKQIFSICSAVILWIAGVAMTGCNTNNPTQPSVAQVYHVSIQAGKGDANQQNGPRRILSLTENTLNATWAAEEQVTVRNLTKEADLTGYLEAQSNGAQTMLSGDLEGVINAGDALELKFLSPAYTTQEGTLEYISAHCDYAVATIHVTSVNYDEITFQENIADFQNQQAIVKFTLMNEAKDAALEATELVVEVNGASYTVTPASKTNELFVALPGFSDQTIKLTATVGSETYTFTSPTNGVTFENSQYYTITVGMAVEVHPFSISPTQQIEFAHGNLQYQPSTGTWRIAREQYDFVGDEDAVYSNGDNDFTELGTVYEGGTKSNNLKFVSATESPFKDLVDPDYTGWMDLFGWNTANNPLKKDLAKSAYTSTPFVDWGHNPIYDPKANETWPADTWRTLTRAEYEYLFCKRPNAQQKLGLASLEGHEKGVIKGVIILPDEFVMPSELESKGFKNILQTHDYVEGAGTYNSRSKYICKTGAIYHGDMTSEIFESDSYIYNQNHYTIAEWEKLEEAGAVFLPAAGRRDFTTSYTDPSVLDYIFVWFIGRMAVYWTSTPNEGGGEEPHAWICTCDDQHFSLGHTQSPCQGQSVRLVRDL